MCVLNTSATHITNYDSSIVKTIIPSRANEEKVFKQLDLDFAKKIENKDQQNLWDRFLMWLADLIYGNTSTDARSNSVNLFMWVFAIVGLGLIIWLLTRTEFTSFLKGNTKKTEFNFADVDEDITTINFNDRITKAENESNYRLAIRWHYLNQLNNLNEKGLIKYEPFKTNIDYTMELTKGSQKEAFKNTSTIYDYVWYGNYSIDKTSYEKFKKSYE